MHESVYKSADWSEIWRNNGYLFSQGIRLMAGLLLSVCLCLLTPATFAATGVNPNTEPVPERLAAQNVQETWHKQNSVYTEPNAYTEPKMLIPVGHTVGVKLFSRGVLVVKINDGITPARSCGLQTGDVIVKCGGVPVTSTEQFQLLLQKSGGADTELQVNRQQSSQILNVEPISNEQGVYCIGAWIRDSMAGIGTMTYYDPETLHFGALGHGITDVDTAQLMPFSNGAILSSKVKAVRKGESGSPGELRGDFDLSEDLGSLYANTDRGIFGILSEGVFSRSTTATAFSEPVPIAAAKTGKACILSNIQGDDVESYTIEILQTANVDGRDMILSVTDPELLALTGGIVQGMSGSPILQDGKLVGAVTHVLLNDPSRGYGISVQAMLAAGDNSG